MNSKRQREIAGCKGFTLVEMLGVLLIMAIFLGMGINMVRNLDQGKSISAAVALSEGIFDQARAAAMSRGTAARVVIHNDPADSERFRRYLAVAVLENQSNDPLNPSEQWVVKQRGVLLPQGSFFDQRGSGLIGSRLAPNSMSIPLPGEQQGAINCFFYEFNGQGILTSPGPGAGYVLFRGALPPNATEPIPVTNPDSQRPADPGGFVIWKQGNSSRIQDSSQIDY